MTEGTNNFELTVHGTFDESYDFEMRGSKDFL